MNFDEKLKYLIKEFPPSSVITTNLLRKNGYTYNDINYLCKKAWLIPISKGVYSFFNQEINEDGYLWTLQQENPHIHFAGRYGLTKYHNICQYVRKEKPMLFVDGKFKLPTWVNDKVELINTNFIKEGLGLERKGNLNTPSLELSVLETLYLCPSRISSCECYELMEFVNVLRPNIMQKLLENCNSVKTNRLLLTFANIQKH